VFITLKNERQTNEYSIENKELSTKTALLMMVFAKRIIIKALSKKRKLSTTNE